jgi:hypothetical protein
MCKTLSSVTPIFSWIFVGLFATCRIFVGQKSAEVTRRRFKHYLSIKRDFDCMHAWRGKFLFSLYIGRRDERCTRAYTSGANEGFVINLYVAACSPCIPEFLNYSRGEGDGRSRKSSLIGLDGQIIGACQLLRPFKLVLLDTTTKRPRRPFTPVRL